MPRNKAVNDYIPKKRETQKIQTFIPLDLYLRANTKRKKMKLKWIELFTALIQKFLDE